MHYALPQLSGLAVATCLAIVQPVRAQQETPPPEPAVPATPTEESVPVTEQPSVEAIRAALEALDSDDFRAREAATDTIWKMGSAAEELLREAVRNGSGEMRYRGGRILEEFELGLYPDTPKEIRALVTTYRNGDEQRRQFAVRQLAALDQTELLAKLVRRERDPNMRTIIAEILGDGVERLAPMHIAKGELEKAEELLKIAALAKQGMKNYAAFLAGTGKLSEAIQQQRKIAGDSLLDSELLAWLLRVNGQFEEAAAQFEAAEQPATARRTLAASGSPLAFAEACIDRSKSDMGVLGYQLASARLSGDAEGAKKILEAIDEYGAAIPDDAPHCFSVLILNGYPDRAFDLARKLGHEDLISMALARYDFKEAFRAIGTKDPRGPYDAWLADFSKSFKIQREADIPEAIEPATRLARACVQTGQTGEAVRILSAVSRLLEASGESQVAIVNAAARLRLTDFAVESAVKAMELETEFAVLEALFATSRGLGSMSTKIWEHLRETKPDQSTEAALRELGALRGDTWYGEADPEPIIASLRAEAEDAPATEKGEILLFAGDLAYLHSAYELAIDAYRAALGHIGADASYRHHRNFGGALLGAERNREAATQFELAWKTNESNPIPIYYKGLALARAGDKGEGDALRQRSALMALGNTYSLSNLAVTAYGHDDYDLGLAADRTVTRLARPDSEPENENFRSATQRIAKVHLSRREFGPAAAALEIYTLGLIKPNVYSAAPTLADHMDLGKVKARALLDAGKADDAAALVAEFLKCNPSDSSMLEDVFQMLVDRDKSAEANALFDTVYPNCLAAAETFPNYGQYHNNMAWLLSRCGKKLDEALVHSERANKLEPDNGAFLDTLAEVQFQRGDREKAIATSEKAVALLDGDAQVLYQLERFKSGKPTDR